MEYGIQGAAKVGQLLQGATSQSQGRALVRLLFPFLHKKNHQISVVFC
jgi:hypothetical protein